MTDLTTQVPIPNTRMVDQGGVPVKAWFDFFTTLFLRTGGPTAGASNLLDTLGSARGGMLSRFSLGWAEFVASIPNTIPVLTPGADVQLFTITQLLNLIGGVQGQVLFRGAAGWQVLAPVAGKFFKSNGAGADPSYSDVAAAVASVDTGLVATGTVQADSLPLTKIWSIIATAAAGTGAMLPNLGLGIQLTVYNDGANALLVYPPVGGQINALAINAGYSLPAARNQFFQQVTATLWRTSILG